MPPVPRIEQHADRLIAHIAGLTGAIEKVVAHVEAVSLTTTEATKRVDGIEKRLAALEKKPPLP